MTRAPHSDIRDMRVVLHDPRERAALCQLADSTLDPVWFPLSVVELSDNGDGTHTLTAPAWILKREGWL